MEAMDSKKREIDILYLEDDEIDIQQMQREFMKVNELLEIEIAKSAQKALNMLYGRNSENKVIPKIILLDLNMPKMSGVDFLKQLRDDTDFIDIQVFVLTGVYTSEEKLAMKELNVRGHIIKPLEYKDALNIFWALEER